MGKNKVSNKELQQTAINKHFIEQKGLLSTKVQRLEHSSKNNSTLPHIAIENARYLLTDINLILREHQLYYEKHIHSDPVINFCDAILERVALLKNNKLPTDLDKSQLTFLSDLDDTQKNLFDKTIAQLNTSRHALQKQRQLDYDKVKAALDYILQHPIKAAFRGALVPYKKAGLDNDALKLFRHLYRLGLAPELQRLQTKYFLQTATQTDIFQALEKFNAELLLNFSTLNDIRKVNFNNRKTVLLKLVKNYVHYNTTKKKFTVNKKFSGIIQPDLLEKYQRKLAIQLLSSNATKINAAKTNINYDSLLNIIDTRRLLRKIRSEADNDIKTQLRADGINLTCFYQQLVTEKQQKEFKKSLNSMQERLGLPKSIENNKKINLIKLLQYSVTCKDDQLISKLDYIKVKGLGKNTRTLIKNLLQTKSPELVEQAASSLTFITLTKIIDVKKLQGKINAEETFKAELELQHIDTSSILGSTTNIENEYNTKYSLGSLRDPATTPQSRERRASKSFYKKLAIAAAILISIGEAAVAIFFFGLPLLLGFLIAGTTAFLINFVLFKQDTVDTLKQLFIGGFFNDEQGNRVSQNKRVAIRASFAGALAVGICYAVLEYFSTATVFSGLFSTLGIGMAPLAITLFALVTALACIACMTAIFYIAIADIIKNDRIQRGLKALAKSFKLPNKSSKSKHDIAIHYIQCGFNVLFISTALLAGFVITVLTGGLFYKNTLDFFK